ncbi:hypothetical protein PRZ48_000179 [Zasmidium cellare]|uniref:Uncharacterized protein n=1 Tax=Zasmidium cellare TaxID=395010 RepID=A0ABR0EY41_ZASCE|nr:hypothetical protein PRZ48_000179 [Zasmidium cellare]
MATVGPASAACMIPRLRQWTVKKQDFFSAATSDELFPVDLIGSSYQPTKGQFGDRVGPPHEREYLTLLDAYNNQTASGDTQMGLWKIDQLDYPLTLTNECGTTSCTASIQNSLLATIYDSKNWSAPALIEARVEGAMDAQSEVQCIADDAIRLDSSVRPTELKFRLGQEEVTGRLRQEDTENLAPSPERGAFCWLIFADMPENATLGGVVVVTSSWGDEPATLYPCAFQLRWTPTTLQYSVSAISSQPSPHSAQVRKVRASRSWLDTFASARWNGSSAYESLTNGQKYVVWPDADYASDWLFTILPVLLAVALSRTADPAASEDLWHFDRTRPDAPVFKVAFFKQGYGWGPESLAIRISLAILLLYCLIAIGHTIYSIYTGLSSTAWDSISEVAALALNSPTPTEMLNTRAGIKTAAVFEHRVRITAMAEDKDNSDEGESADSDGTMDGADPVGTRLALLFPSDEDKIASNVRVNTVY